MDPDEAEICEYLKAWRDQFVSAREICRRAGGKWRYREDERWALPVLLRLLEKQLVEDDGAGHYRLVTQHSKQNEKKKRWISPEIQIIFRQSGKKFGVFDLDTELDPDDCTAGSELSPQLDNGEQVPGLRE